MTPNVIPVTPVNDPPVAGDPIALQVNGTTFLNGTTLVYGELQVLQTIVTPGITVNGGVGANCLVFQTEVPLALDPAGTINVSSKSNVMVSTIPGQNQLKVMEGAFPGQLVIVRPAPGMTLIVKHNSGSPRSIFTKNNSDITLSGENQARMFVLHNNNWTEL